MFPIGGLEGLLVCTKKDARRSRAVVQEVPKAYLSKYSVNRIQRALCMMCSIFCAAVQK